PPELLQQYRLLEKVGGGGMGVVYRAVHTRLKKEVAVKLLPPHRCSDPAAVPRFQREMEAVGRLEHPNLVRATDAGDADGRHLLAMDFGGGRALAGRPRRCGALPVAEACELVRQAALGLQCVHEAGLVHRDVKPSNLMVTPEGTVKVLDLGLACLRQAPPAGELTGTLQVLGTAHYIAPAQGAPSPGVDPRAAPSPLRG